MGYNSEYCHPKYIISLVNKYTEGKELNPLGFTGSKKTNNFLRVLGFNVVKTLFSQKSMLMSLEENRETRFSKKRHNERCPKCKETVRKLLEKIYGNVQQNYKFEVGTEPGDFRNNSYYDKLRIIYETLQNNRGFEEFVKAKTLPNCDFFVPNPGFIVEFDESQHFTLPRKIALEFYPEQLELGFDKKRWVELCERINAKDNDPPFRDEQRAWYDTLRDFLPGIKALNPTKRIYSKEMKWCSLNSEDPGDLSKFKELIESRQKLPSSWVATVILQSNGRYSNHERLEVLPQIVDLVVKETEGDGVIIFPGGWFSADEEEARSLYDEVEKNVRDILARNERNIVICLGIDGRVAQYAKDQIGIAISKNGIEAIGRKFHPAPNEKGYVDLAKDHLSKEENKSRVFSLSGKKYFLCACYDSFGIKQRGIPKFGIDVILDLVHHFYKPRRGPSGTFYFARDGFAGASRHWSCPVFGAVVFFDRDPKNWPSGVYWNQGDKDIKKWQYSDNPLKPKVKLKLETNEGMILIEIYNLCK